MEKSLFAESAFFGRPQFSTFAVVVLASECELQLDRQSSLVARGAASKQAQAQPGRPPGARMAPVEAKLEQCAIKANCSN